VGLAKGLVDCEVAPRQGRPPFLVVAGDVTVTVVGTRFQVEKREAVRVSVTHGKVNVESSSGRRQVATGESWASGELVVAAQPAPEAAPEPPPAVAASPSPSPAPALPEPDLSVEKKLLRKAEAMDRSDPKEAMRIYVSLVQARDKAVAARSIYSLALLEFNARHYEEAVRWSERYLDKHPHGRNADDVFQVRVESYFALEYNQRARDVAREYLQRFPASRYAERARRIANW
jgi:tetratricopeptide (TPR) repeat protein